VTALVPTHRAHRPGPPAPNRWRAPGPATVVLVVVVLGLVGHGVAGGAVVDPSDIPSAAERLQRFLAAAFPPSLDRIDPVLRSLLVTFEMALIGTIGGVLLSVPLALAAARNTSPHPGVERLSRALIALFRAVPDLIWGLIFVVAVGLGPPAGVMAILVDVTGFCGRFFADAIEEVDEGVMDGLRATGASRTGIVTGAVMPSCMPSFVATSMFALESATRSSVVLGVVGAGGIGIELTTSMQLLRYDEASLIILLILVVVMSVERLSAAFRRRLL
jgi:phosphonate transport system permease protein